MTTNKTVSMPGKPPYQLTADPVLSLRDDVPVSTTRLVDLEVSTGIVVSARVDSEDLTHQNLKLCDVD